MICPECAKPRDLFTPGSDLPMCWTAKRKVWFCLKHDIEVPGVNAIGAIAAVVAWARLVARVRRAAVIAPLLGLGVVMLVAGGVILVDLAEQRMNADELEYLVERCLGEGVPGVVARVFDLSPDLVHEARALMKVRRYGTEDLAEYTLQAQWDAIEQARHVLAHGSPAERAKFSAALFVPQSARTAKDLPDGAYGPRGGPN